MALGGPETDLARGQLDIEAAIQSAVDPGMAIVGDSAPEVTTRRPPQVPQFEPAEYGWRPSQEDMGQRPVAQIQVDGFNTPVAQRGLPHGAIAARQQALAERKNALAAEKQRALEAFGNPLKGITTADPYNADFNKAIIADFNRRVQEQANATHGGDVSAWYTDAMKDPEKRLMIQQWAQEYQAAADEGKGRYKNVMDLLDDFNAGDIQFEDPQDYENLIGYVNRVNPSTGAPIEGQDIGEVLRIGRGLEPRMFKEKYGKEFLADFEKFLAPDFEAGTAEKLPGGKYTILDTEIKRVEDFIDSHADSLIEHRIFDNKQDAVDFLSKRIYPKMKVKRTTYSETFSPERKEAAKAKAAEGAAPQRRGGWGYSPRQFIIGDDIGKGASADRSAESEFVAAPNDVGPNKSSIPPRPIKLHEDGSPQGALVVVTGFQRVGDTGDWLVLGERVDSKSIDKFNIWRQDSQPGSAPVTEKDVASDPAIGEQYSMFVTEHKQDRGRPYQSRLSKNEAQIRAKFQTADPYVMGGVTDALARASAEAGTEFTAKMFESLTREQKQKFMQKYGGQ